jgi:sugar lactone lactonase YvrE
MQMPLSRSRVTAGQPPLRPRRQCPARNPSIEALETRLCPSGYLLVDSFDNNSILRYNESTGAFVDTLIPKGSGGLNDSVGMILGRDDNLYVSNHLEPLTSGQTSSVLRFNGASGAFLSVIADSSQVSSPRSICFGPDGNLYVAEGKGPGTILRFDGTTGAFLDDFVPTGSDGLSHPTAMLFGPDGTNDGKFDLYVASLSGILRFDGTTGEFKGTFVASGAGGLVSPLGMTFGPDGNLYVTNAQVDFTSNQAPPGCILRSEGPTGPNPGAPLGPFVPTGRGGLSTPLAVLFGPDVNGDGHQDLYVTSATVDEYNLHAHPGTSQVLCYDGVTGAFLQTLVASGSGGLDFPTAMVFTETDPVTLDYDGATASPATAASAPQTTATTTRSAPGPIGPVSNSPGGFTVVATGLDNPRGLAFGPDGQLYVAQGGPATNTLSTVGQHPQIPAPIGPYTGGFNSSIVRIDPGTGMTTTVVSGLPSSQTSPGGGSLVSGVSSVQFIGNTLYGMEAGAGSSHGLAGTDNTIFRVNPDGTMTTIADFSAFVKANPVQNPDPEDFEPDGTWYDMVAVRGELYATEPNHQEVDQITPDGRIIRLIDMSVLFPGNSTPSQWVGPTGIAYHGNFYVSTLGQFPVTPGSDSIYKLNPGGQLKTAASGLTAVVAVAFDSEGRMYALETETVPGFPGPGAAGTGAIVRIDGGGTQKTIATGLTFPTAMTFGPDGNLYVSNVGFGVPVPGAGEIVRIDMSSAASAFVSAADSGARVGPFTVPAGAPPPDHDRSRPSEQTRRRPSRRTIRFRRHRCSARGEGTLESVDASGGLCPHAGGRVPGVQPRQGPLLGPSASQAGRE